VLSINKKLIAFFEIKKARKMQREIINGVPYFIDGQSKLYTWEIESTPQHIGVYKSTTQSIEYTEGFLEKLEGKLQSWRSKQEPRARKAKVTNSRGNRSRKVSVTESSDADE
jgi:hypothetical protein